MGKDGAVAQSVEQRTENPCVGGSIPPHTTYFILDRCLSAVFILLKVSGVPKVYL